MKSATISIKNALEHLVKLQIASVLGLWFRSRGNISTKKFFDKIGIDATFSRLPVENIISDSLDNIHHISL